jgi:hypothetical protein
MCKRVPVSLALGIAVFGLACSDGPESTPTDPQLAPASACDFRAIRSAVRSYFLTTEERLALADVDVMETNCGVDAATQTNAGYNVIRFLERGLYKEFLVEPRTGTPNSAATLLSELFKKMPNANVAATTNFLPVTSPGGLLGVRGGASDPLSAPVYSRAPTSSNPRWGIEPPSGIVAPATEPEYTSDWPTMSGNVRLALYGSGPAPFTTLQTLGTSYSIHASQAVTFNPEAIVGVCKPTDDAGPNRVQHKVAPNANAANSPVLALQVPLFCDGTFTAMRLDPERRSLADRLLDFFAPSPLHAALLNRSGGGGGISTLSDFEYVTAGSVEQSFDTAPADAEALAPIPVVVRVFAVGTTNTPPVPVEGVTVSLTIVGNMGSYNLVALTPLTQTTDETGVLSFSFTLDKPGGYTLTSNASVGGYTIEALNSDMFHITQ